MIETANKYIETMTTLPLSHWLPPLSSRGPGWSSTATEAPPPEADGGKEPELAAASFKTGSTKRDKSIII